LEDLRPSQVVFSGRLDRCEKLTSWGGRMRKFSAPIHMRRAQAAGATSLTKPLMRISSIKTTAINPYTVDRGRVSLLFEYNVRVSRQSKFSNDHPQNLFLPEHLTALWIYELTPQ